MTNFPLSTYSMDESDHTERLSVSYASSPHGEVPNELPEADDKAIEESLKWVPESTIETSQLQATRTPRSNTTSWYRTADWSANAIPPRIIS